MSYCSPMELRHLRYFVAVAAHGSFNRAAEILHLTQPALSRQVKDLEDELGVPLLVRGQNTVKLTEAGELFYDEAREVLARAAEAVQRVRCEARSETLRVGYAPSMTAGVMPAALEKFQSATPRVRIELADLSSREINELANEGRLDLVISPGISVTKGIPGFQWTELRRVGRVFQVVPGFRCIQHRGNEHHHEPGRGICHCLDALCGNGTHRREDRVAVSPDGWFEKNRRALDGDA